MGVINFRAGFEGVRFADDAGAHPETVEMIAGLTSWLFNAGLSSSLIARERSLLQIRPNGWERDILEALGDAIVPESIGVLLSGVKLAPEPPPYDRRYDAEPLLRLLPFLSDSPFVTHPGMPAREEWTAMATGVTAAPVSDVARGGRVAGLWWWRAVNESLVRLGKAERRRLVATLRDSAATSRTLGIPITDDDFSAFAKPYSALTTDEHRAVSAIAGARVRAFRWMLGSAAWDEVSMDAQDSWSP
jgi:hypothetical protein